MTRKFSMVGLYVSSVVLVNWGFSNFPGYELFWSTVVGTIFITRDLAQRAVGKWWILIAMAGAGAISYVMANPFVAVASILAFAVSELADWAVFTLSRRPLHDRILISSTIATPLDSAVFLGMLGLLSPPLFAAQVASKMLSAVVVWAALRFRHAWI
jgi:uncharacterized PurR-regulated membrane protein YhhQ (DUF165 family)